MLREALVDLRLRRAGTAPGAVPGKRSRAAAKLREAAGIPADDLFRTYQTDPNGLSEPDAAERLEQHGPNQVAHERPPTWYVQLWHGFANAFSALLATLAVVSLATGDRESAVIIGAMVLLSGLLRFFQERRAVPARRSLKSTRASRSMAASGSERTTLGALLRPSQLDRLRPARVGHVVEV